VNLNPDVNSILRSIVLSGVNQCAELFVERSVLQKLNDLNPDDEELKRAKAFLHKHLRERAIKPFGDVSDVAPLLSRRAIIFHKPTDSMFRSDQAEVIYNVIESRTEEFDLYEMLNGVIRLRFILSFTQGTRVSQVLVKTSEHEHAHSVSGGQLSFDLELSEDEFAHDQVTFTLRRGDKQLGTETLTLNDLGVGETTLYVHKDGAKYKLSKTQPKKKSPVKHRMPRSEVFQLAKAHKSVPIPQMIDVAAGLDVGSTIKDSRGGQLQVGTLIGSGGEGAIYEVAGQPDQLIKIYTKQIPDHQEAKLKRMVQLQGLRADKCIAYPSDLAYSSGKFVGYLMERVNGSPLHVMNYPTLKETQAINDRRGLVRVAINYIKTVSKIHRQNILLVDINEGNILIDLKSQMVSIVDLDSAQIEDFPCLVGIEDNFSGDMIQRRRKHAGSNKHVLSSMWDEMFSIYVFVFKILMGGRHPYDHKKRDMSQHKNISANFVYPHKGRGDRLLIPGVVTPKLWDKLNEKMREVFSLGFRENTRNLDELKSALEKYHAYLEENPQSRAQIFF
jgi:serine/threonine protein kinase